MKPFYVENSEQDHHDFLYEEIVHYLRKDEPELFDFEDEYRDDRMDQLISKYGY